MENSTSISPPEQQVDYRALSEQLGEQTKELEAQLKASNDKVAELSFQLDQLRRMIFGAKRERYVPSDPNVVQGGLFEGREPDLGEHCTIAGSKEVTYIKAKTVKPKLFHPGRASLPENLRREDVILEPQEDTAGYKKIGEEITEELDYIPPELFVRRYIRPKYVCQAEVESKHTKGAKQADGSTIIIAEMPMRPIHKCIAGSGLLTQVIIDKYADHLPLNRQLQRYSRLGIDLPISTITGWVDGVAKLLEPLGAALTETVVNSDYLHVDETTIQVLKKHNKGPGKNSPKEPPDSSHRGYFWVYHDSINKLVYFDYQPGRGREGPSGILNNFKGYLQVDGYEVYESFGKRPGITLLGCLAHARRKYYDALKNDEQRAGYVLEQMKVLYNLEKEIKDKSYETKKQERQERALPVLNELGEWIKDELLKVPPKSAIGQALSYSAARWNKFKVYTTDGRLKIDNNPVERQVRPVTVGRKNFLFCGSHKAARNTGIIYSLMGTCKLHDVNPYLWLKDVIERMPTHPADKMNELLPHIWCKQRSDNVPD